MKKKKVFTEKQIKQALYSIFKEISVDDDFMNDDSYACGYSDALIDVFCYIFNEVNCSVNFGVVEDKKSEAKK